VPSRIPLGLLVPIVFLFPLLFSQPYLSIKLREVGWTIHFFGFSLRILAVGAFFYTSWCVKCKETTWFCRYDQYLSRANLVCNCSSSFKRSMRSKSEGVTTTHTERIIN
jgi:hypothetical protein